jgi:hypothetical protein
VGAFGAAKKRDAQGSMRKHAPPSPRDASASGGAEHERRRLGPLFDLLWNAEGAVWPRFRDAMTAGMRALGWSDSSR